MESAQEKIDRVEKLKDDNYQYWSFQTKMFLQSKDLWFNVMDGDVPVQPRRPPISARRANESEAAHEQRLAEDLKQYEATVETFNEWQKKDRKAMNYIALSVDRANANLIYNLESGVQAWKVLREHHNMATLGSKLRVKKKLYAMKIEKNGSMYKHLNEMIELFNKLADIEGVMPEDQKVTTILSSVEPYYNAATSAIMGWPEERLTVRGVKDYLVEEWIKMKTVWEGKEADDARKKRLNEVKAEEVWTHRAIMP
jgi:gag-polypeptide of LTR copia-type